MVLNGDHPERRDRCALEIPRLPPEEQPLGGFIFFCNDDTMPRDLERCLFGLPKSFIDPVRGIRKGLPLFLYNYSDRLLHGVFEASSDGGLNLDPSAWATKDVRSGGELSRYPAQVRVRVRENRVPLEEDVFRPVLYHYEPKKFRLELSLSQTAALLKLFGNQRVEPSASMEPGGPKSTRKRNGFTGYNGGSHGTSRADLAQAWRSLSNGAVSPVDGTGGDRNRVVEVPLLERDGECSSASRFSYVAALKTGMQPSLHQRGSSSSFRVAAPDGTDITGATSTAGVHDRLCDPDPAVNSDHQAFPGLSNGKSSGRRNSQQAKPWKVKDETRKKMPMTHLHSFTHLPRLPFLTPIHFPVFPPPGNDDGLCYRPPVEAYVSLPPGVAWSQPPVVFLPPPPPLPSPLMAANIESNFGVLHTEIMDFARTARPSPLARARAEAAVDCVRRAVKQLWAGAEVEVFGSFATGLCLPHSDVDVVVLDVPASSDVADARGFLPLIRDLATEFEDHHRWCKSIMTIETASMPVIKLCCEPSPDETPDAPPVAIDVTLGGKSSSTLRGGLKKRQVANSPFVHNGAAAREYVLDKLLQLPALAPLVLLMKSFLHRRGLNSVYNGGLGSFSLTLMLVFYLEQVPLSWGGTSPAGSHQHAAVPSSVASSQSEMSDSEDDETIGTDSTSSAASEELANGCGRRHEELISRAWRIVDDLLVCLQAPGAPNLGSLLIGFLHIFGQELDFSRAKIILKSSNGNSGGMFMLEPSFQPTSLWIDDPLRPGMNVGAGSFAMNTVQAAMQEMLFVLAKPQQAVTSEEQKPGKPLLSHLDQLFQAA